MSLTRSEFTCPCCGENQMVDDTLDMFTMARLDAGVPFVINSGYRCIEHNQEVGGRLNSSHLKGEAGDIKCVDLFHRYKMIRALMGAGFQRIGIGKTFIHADNDKQKPRCVIWTY